MNISQDQKILDHIGTTHGMNIVSSMAITKGINSSIYKLTDVNNNTFALKIYPKPSSKDPRKRFQHEMRFIEYMSHLSISNIPRVVSSSSSMQYCLFDWINGKSIEAFKKQHIGEIARFIIKLNTSKNFSLSQTLPKASEAIMSFQSIIDSITYRIKSIVDTEPNSEVGMQVKSWIKEIIEPLIIIELRNFHSYKNDPAWNDCSIGQFVSPSDMGVHNVLSTSQGLYFIDFEYAGLDDMSKLIGDIVMQPNSPLDKTKEDVLIEELTARIPGDSSMWYTRYLSIKPLVILKWILIMLRPYQENKIGLKRWSQIKAYAKRYSIQTEST